MPVPYSPPSPEQVREVFEEVKRFYGPKFEEHVRQENERGYRIRKEFRKVYGKFPE